VNTVWLVVLTLGTLRVGFALVKWAFTHDRRHAQDVAQMFKDLGGFLEDPSAQIKKWRKK
jgi:hypothetical protein